MARTNALNVDLIIITGNLLDGAINDRETGPALTKAKRNERAQSS